MSAAIPFMMMASAAVSAIGAISQGNAANSAAKYNAQVMDNQAATTRQQGVAREEVQRQQARQVIGQQLAAGAQSGTELSGSSLDVLNQSMFNAESDALNIRYERELNAVGLKSQATLTRAQGKQARNGGYLSAAGSLLNGASGYLNAGGKVPSWGSASTVHPSTVGMSI